MKSKSTYIYARVLEALKQSLIYPNWCVKTEKYNDEFIRVIRERQCNEFTRESQKNFFSNKFIISAQSDRMGYRLTGEKLKLKKQLEMISEPVCFETVQVPPDGKPIVLLADRQTTGGYPKIAKIVDVDVCKIVQSKPGDSLKFKEISLEEAEKLASSLVLRLSVVKRKKVILHCPLSIVLCTINKILDL